MKIKLISVSGLYNQLISAQGIKNASIGFKNVVVLNNYITMLGDHLKELHNFSKDNTKVGADGKPTLDEKQLEEFKMLSEKEVEINEIEFDTTDEMFQKNVTLGHLEALILTKVIVLK